MKHSINELYTIYNSSNRIRLATRAYCDANNIPCVRFGQGKKMEREGLICAVACISHTNNNKPFNVLDVDGIKSIHLFGEKTWFDTAEELAEHRAQYQAERQASAEKTKVKEEIISILDGMELLDLEALLTKLS